MTATPPLTLADTRSFQERSVEWCGTGCGACVAAVLTQRKVRRAKDGAERLGKPQAVVLAVSEFSPDFPARAFHVRRVGKPGVRNVLVTDEWVECSCPGREYEATEKADRRAGARFGETCGCVHGDVTLALLAVGAFGPPVAVRAAAVEW